MALHDSGAFLYSFTPQRYDKLRELDPVVAALKTHMATEAGPDGPIFNIKYFAIQSFLDDKARIKINVKLSYRTNDSTFTAIQTQPDSSILYFLIQVIQFQSSSNTTLIGITL